MKISKYLNSTSKHQEEFIVFQQELLGITKSVFQVNFRCSILTQDRSTFQKCFITNRQSFWQYFCYTNRAYISDIISRGLSSVYKFN